MMKLCKHYKPLKLEKIANFITNYKPKCLNQDKHTPEKQNLWQCLSCNYVGCGRSNAKECAQKHSFHSSHPACINPKTGEIYCYKCDQSLQQQIDLANGMEMESPDLDLLVEFSEKCQNLCKNYKNKNGKEDINKVLENFNENTHSKSNNTHDRYNNKMEVQNQPNLKSNVKLMQEGEKLNVFGLSNLGNTCFYNSVLQCLYATTSLHSTYPYIDFSKLDSTDTTAEEVEDVYGSINIDQKFVYNKPKTIPSTNVNKRFQNFLAKANAAKNTMSPSDLFDAVGNIKSRFRSMAQQDAQQLLRCLLDGLNEGEITYLDIDRKSLKVVELNGKRQKWTTLQKIFGCFLASRLHCLNCQKISWTLDLCLDLNIQISSTSKTCIINLPNNTPIPKQQIHQQGLVYPSDNYPVPDMLEHFFSAEPLSKINYFNCQSCKASKATKKLFIKDPPRNLTIVLKRFTNTGQKNNANVPFPFELNLSGVVINSGVWKYNLYGVVVHQGGAGGGHYIAYTRRGNNWYYFSDSHFRQVSASTVKNSQAYLLFYELEC